MINRAVRRQLARRFRRLFAEKRSRFHHSVGFGTAASTSATSGSSLAITITVTGGTHSVVVGVTVIPTTDTVSTVTDTGSNSYTNVSSKNNSTNVREELWVSSSTPVGSSATSVTVTMSAGVTDLVVCVATYTGVKAWGAFSKSQNNTGSASPVTVTQTNGNIELADSFIIMVGGSDGGGAVTANTGNLRTSTSIGSGKPDGGLVDNENNGTTNTAANGLTCAFNTKTASTNWACLTVEARAMVEPVAQISRNSINNTSATSVTTSAVQTWNSGNLMAVFFMTNSNQAITSITNSPANGEAWAQLVGLNNGAGLRGEMWTATAGGNTSVGSVTVNIAVAALMIVVVVVYNGIVGNSGTNSGTGTAVAVSVTIGAVGNLFVASDHYLGSVVSSTPTAPTADRDLAETTSGSEAVMEEGVTASGSQTINATLGASEAWVALGMEVKPPSVKAIPTRNLLGAGL